MAFTGTLDKCKACDKTVYVVDMLSLEGMPYHKSCFKCSHCKGTLVVCVILYLFFFFSTILFLPSSFLKNVPLPDEQLLIHGWSPLLQASFRATFQGIWQF